MRTAVRPAGPSRRMATIILAMTLGLGRPAVAQAPAVVPPAKSMALPLRISWGHRSAVARPFFVRLVGLGVGVGDAHLDGVELPDVLEAGSSIARTIAGAGDVDELSCRLRFAPATITNIANVHSIWKYLWRFGDAGAAQRLQADPANRPDSRQVAIELNGEGTRGFRLTVDQLVSQKSFWFPELDLFVAAGEVPETLAGHLSKIEGRRGQRVLDRVERDAEASYRQFAGRWEDMGSAAFQNPNAVSPGHIVGLTWDSALYKFGVDRFAGVRNDESKVDRFTLSFDFGEAAQSLTNAWRGQQLTDGLPVMLTTFEKDGVRCQVEQFAYPLHGPPAAGAGDLQMVLLEKVQLSERQGSARTVEVRLGHERGLPVDRGEGTLRIGPGGMAWEDGAGRTLLAVDGPDSAPTIQNLPSPRAPSGDAKMGGTLRQQIQFNVRLPAGGTRELIVRLPSPAVEPRDREALLALDYQASRQATLNYWNDALARGAFFEVPDPAVNTLFRANFWHARRLPRRHGEDANGVKVDLPYSNFAYGQTGTPWPVNQSVYVDYMLYDLRGYHALSAEEHAIMFANNQEANGHIGGFANWGVYTPGMLYSVAQHFLLSGDRASFERLLPPTLRALDWCLDAVQLAGRPPNPTPGLVLAPLNDLSHAPRSWAFNQAYFVAGLDRLGRALAEIGHPRAASCRAAARTLREAVEREFGRASVRSPAVPLADGTWTPYVPCDAQSAGRQFTAWYPTDVDTGPLHLSRLQALDPHGPLTTAMLHDHEDNLFLRQWGMINEPVYNQQATAYLRRDEVKAAIRAFYSMMACAFSHTVFEPVEHRWGWPQYFGPPSTDGAWFELYRRLLIDERDDDTLLLAQATPRAWLEPGQHIVVRNAPTYFGPLSFRIDSRAADGELSADIDLPARRSPSALRIRLRHARASKMKSVQINGGDWRDFDPGGEWVRIPHPTDRHYAIRVHY